MKPSDLSLLRTPGRPGVSPSGGWAVVAITRPDVEKNAYRSQLWRVPLDPELHGPPVRLTSGPADSHPVVSPDGSRIAFLRGGDGPAQLAVLDVAGGEPTVLTSHRLGLSGRPVFSPEGERIAYVAAVPEPGRYGTVEDVGPDAEPARHITTFTYRSDGAGFTQGRPGHVHVIGLPPRAEPTDGSPEAVVPVRLTDGDLAHSSPVWTPDGSRLLALRERPDALRGDLVALAVPADVDTETANLAESDRATAVRDGLLVAVEPEIVTTPGTVAFDAVVFGNVELSLVEVDEETGAERDLTLGHEVYLLGSDLGADGLGFIGTNSALYRADLLGSELHGVVRLTDPEVDELAGGTGDGAFQVLDGGADAGVLLLRSRRGRTELVCAVPDPDGESAVLTVLHPGTVTGAIALPDGRIVATATLEDSPGEVLLLDPELDGVVPLTDLAAPLRAVTGVNLSVEVGGTAPDGYPLHGWVALPDPAVHGAGPYPVLLNIHGGPYAAYEDVFFDETQVYTGAGYAVVYGNPRGSGGYGQTHGRAVVGGFGTVDADDVTALLDHALATRPELDVTRVGVLGGSYGGYMTAWLTTRTDRFAAAIVERGFLDPVSFEGSSDIGWFFGLRYLGEDAALVAAQSPMAHIARVTTPTLVIHSEQDWRCPVEQGQRWYVGLKRRGVPAELLLFPGEGHELSRSGRPQHRVQRFEAILEWWSRHLPVG